MWGFSKTAATACISEAERLKSTPGTWKQARNNVDKFSDTYMLEIMLFYLLPFLTI